MVKNIVPAHELFFCCLIYLVIFDWQAV
jgi:hypothetical protein